METTSGIVDALPRPKSIAEVKTDFAHWEKVLQQQQQEQLLKEQGQPDGAQSSHIEQLRNYTRHMRHQLQRLEIGAKKNGTVHLPGRNSTESATTDEESAENLSLPGNGGILELPCGSIEFGSDSSPVNIYISSFSEWLRENPYQGLIASMAVLIGGFCVWDGPGVWRALFTASTAAVAAGVAAYEAEAQDLVENEAAKVVLIMQAAGAMALATHTGYEGSQVLLGFLLGFAGAVASGSKVRSWDGTLHVASLFWYTAGSALGTLVFTVWRQPLLAALGPLAGGLLVSSGTGAVISRLWAALSHADVPALFPASGVPWSTSLVALLGAGGPSALAGHGVCALLALAIHRSSQERRMPAVICLVGYTSFTAMAAVTGFECRRHAEELSCPDWVSSAGNWQWPFVGCLLWAGITGVSAWRQFGMVRTWESRSLWWSYWQAITGKAARDGDGKVGTLPMQAMESAPLLRSSGPAGASSGFSTPPTATMRQDTSPLSRQVDTQSLSQWLSRGRRSQTSPPGSGI